MSMLCYVPANVQRSDTCILDTRQIIDMTRNPLTDALLPCRCIYTMSHKFVLKVVPIPFLSRIIDSLHQMVEMPCRVRRVFLEDILFGGGMMDVALGILIRIIVRYRWDQRMFLTR